MKQAIKIFLVAFFIALVTYVFALLTLGLHALSAKNDAVKLLHTIQSGATVASSEKLTQHLDNNVKKIQSTITGPFFRSFAHQFLEDPEKEFLLLRQLIKIAPSALGTERPMKYLVVFQNSAEARGTGGIIGAYAYVQISRGKITILREGSNVDLKSLDQIPTTMPQEFQDLYGSDPAIWQNSNLSPHFPYAAKIWSALWQKQFNEKPDGVIATDPEALGYVLQAIGPITLASGEKISADNVVEKTLSTAYQRFATDNNARKQYLLEVMSGVVEKLLQGGFSPITLAQKVQTPVLDHRVLISFTNSRDQSLITPTVVSGNLDSGPNNEFRVVIQNTAGNKLDYYLSKQTSITALACNKPLETSVSVTITNHLKTIKNLPDYVIGRLDLNRPHGADGRQGYALMIYGPSNAEITSALRSDQSQKTPYLSSERNRPIAVFISDLAPGASEVFDVVFSGGTGPITYIKQPLVRVEGLAPFKGCK